MDENEYEQACEAEQAAWKRWKTAQEAVVQTRQAQETARVAWVVALQRWYTAWAVEKKNDK